MDAYNRKTTNPLTGEPDAGNPPVRFGGRGEVKSLIPTPIKTLARGVRRPALAEGWGTRWPARPAMAGTLPGSCQNLHAVCRIYELFPVAHGLDLLTLFA